MLVTNLCIQHIFNCFNQKFDPDHNEVHLIFRAAGVTEVQFASVVTTEVNGVVAAFWRDEEASDSLSEIIKRKRKGLWQGVSPLCPVSQFAAIVAENVGQDTGSCVIPHLCLQASSTWI